MTSVDETGGREALVDQLAEAIGPRMTRHLPGVVRKAVTEAMPIVDAYVAAQVEAAVSVVRAERDDPHGITRVRSDLAIANEELAAARAERDAFKLAAKSWAADSRSQYERAQSAVAGNQRLACAYGGHLWVGGAAIPEGRAIYTRDCWACAASYAVGLAEWLLLDPAPVVIPSAEDGASST